MASTSSIQPLALTAFYCCALRAADASRGVPVCGDTFAARFLDEDTRAQLRPILRLRGPAVSNVARHRIIDDIIRDRLRQNAALRIVILGAGLDTRAFRLQGGQWWELDEAALLAFKEERLPANNAPNPLTRIAVDFNSADLRDHLAGYLAANVISIVGSAREAGTMRIPRWLLDSLLRELRDGYAVFKFAPESR